MKLWYHSMRGKALGTIPILLALCGCIDSATRVVNPKVAAFDAPAGAVSHPCAGMAIITPTSWGYTWTNPCNGTAGSGTNGFWVTEFQFQGNVSTWQSATNLAGPWTPPSRATLVWKWSGPYSGNGAYRKQCFFRGPVKVTNYWSRTNLPEVSYNVTNF